MLSAIRTVTYRVSSLDTSRRALCQYLRFREVASGKLPASLLQGWRCPAMSDASFTILQPEHCTDFYIRLIEHEVPASYSPLRTFGWNAAELLVADVHAIAESLRDSPFRILGGPRDLMENGTAIALQVVGPNEELFYLTEINGDPMRRTYGYTRHWVDRLFIAVLGVQDHDRSRAFYAALTNGTTRPRAFSIRVLAAANDLPLTTKFRIGAACLPNQYRIEIDEYPEQARHRQVEDGQMPPGLSIVSFSVDSLDACPLPLDIAHGPDEAPYFGARFAVTEGPDGEWLEFIESV